MTSARSVGHRSLARFGRHCTWGILLACLAAGCSTGANYQAHALPESLRVAAAENAQTIDLSRLATATLNNDAIDRGDVIEVTISAGLGVGDTTVLPIRVGDDGNAVLPVLGAVPLSGLELEDAEVAIASSCVERGLYRSPHVTVTMKRQRLNRVTVIGAVSKPGVVMLPRGSSDLLAAIVSAGGFAKDAGTHVEIRQPGKVPDQRQGRPDAIASAAGPKLTGYSNGPDLGPAELAAQPPLKSTRIDLVSAAKEGRGGLLVDDGSVVMVEKRDPTPIQVIGLVNKPGRYDFPVGQDLRVLDVIALAGGLKSPVANKIWISRPVPNSIDPAVIEVSVQRAKKEGLENLRLMQGDIVSVEQTPATMVVSLFQRASLGASVVPFQ